MWRRGTAFVLFMFCWMANAAEPGAAAAKQVPGWTATASLDAPEANQAAAADEKFVYAITNHQVAKYDRQSGKRVAVSSGEAKHLNSGFLWQGKLYCAHSNYPQTPERSEIKVLDVESMQLATFKDFGSFGGSLTWAVQHAGHWWCNFARYGADNGETFLTKFDTEWNERGRWTYPPEVISRLGHYSLSGGLWNDGELLVTGHDDALCFRLRLPAAGGVLELIDTQAVPFTGQGFASDPRSGGLVGINRARKQVVFAAREGGAARLRVLSYNIHHGEGVDGQLDLERIARVITAVSPDIVSLQEVDEKVARTGLVDQPSELARLTRMSVVFGGNIRLQGGMYGNAVLSRLPIQRHVNQLLPCFDSGERRGVLEVELALPGSNSSLAFLATHLDHRQPNAERLASAKAIHELLARTPGRPALLAGDLNDVIDGEVLKEFETRWTRTNDKPLPTIPVAQPASQIDFVLFQPRPRWKVIETRVLDEAVASDHRAILAVVELIPDK